MGAELSAYQTRRIWDGRRIHFAQRLEERIDPDLNAAHFWTHLVDIMSRPYGPGDDAEFIGRTKSGCRAWLTEWCGHRIVIIYDHDLGCPVTVMPRDGRVCVGRKGRYVDLGAIT